MQIIFINVFILLLTTAIFELKFYTSSVYKTYKKYAFIAVVILLTGIIGFREIGSDNDSRMYHAMFNETGLMSYNDILFHNSNRVKEIGYLLLNKVFNNLGFRIFLLFCAAVSVGIKGYLLYKLTNFPFVSTLIYFVCFFYLREFTQIRDALATSFVLLCLLMYIKEKYLYSVVFFLIALSFHFIALICIGVILLWELYKVKSPFCYVFLAAVIALKIYMPGLDYLSNPFLPSQLTVYATDESLRSFNTGYFLPLFSLFLFIGFYISKLPLKSNFLYFISLLTFISYIYSLNHMVLIRIPNILFFGNIIAIGSTKYMTNNFRWIILIVLGVYWMKIYML